jgi:hypothetical protein
MFSHLSGDRHCCIMVKMLNSLLLSPDRGLLSIWIGLISRLCLLELYRVDPDRVHSCILVNTSSAMLGMRGAVQCWLKDLKLARLKVEKVVLVFISSPG